VSRDRSRSSNQPHRSIQSVVEIEMVARGSVSFFEEKRQTPSVRLVEDGDRGNKQHLSGAYAAWILQPPGY